MRFYLVTAALLLNECRSSGEVREEDTTSTAAAADFCNGIFDNEVERCCITDESIAVRFERSNLLQTKDSSGNFVGSTNIFAT